MAAFHVGPHNLACACGGIPQSPLACIINPGLFGTWPQPEEPAVPVHTHYHFTPGVTSPQRPSDDDVERIAKRVAELLRDGKP